MPPIQGKMLSLCTFLGDRNSKGPVHNADFSTHPPVTAIIPGSPSHCRACALCQVDFCCLWIACRALGRPWGEVCCILLYFILSPCLDPWKFCLLLGMCWLGFLFHNQFKCHVSLVQVNYMVGLMTRCFRLLSGERGQLLMRWPF